MRKSLLLVIAAALAFPPHVAAQQAGGSAPRAWVSGAGADTPNCGGVTAPCRSLQHAHDSIVKPGGTIYIRDAAGYGPVVVSHAVSIINDGVGVALIAAPAGDAIRIQAGANDPVFVKGLVLDGGGTGRTGIYLTSAGNLTVTDCTVKGFKQNGVLINPPTGTLSFSISDLVATENSGASISIVPTLANFASGATANVKGTITRAETSRGTYGVYASGDANTGAIIVHVNNVNASNNFQGIYNGIGSIMFITRSMATGNSDIGVYSNGGTTYTLGDNLFRGNTHDTTGQIVTTAQQ